MKRCSEDEVEDCVVEERVCESVEGGTYILLYDSKADATASDDCLSFKEASTILIPYRAFLASMTTLKVSVEQAKAASIPYTCPML